MPLKRRRQGMRRRERALGHQKGAITTVGSGTPNIREGSDGDLTLRRTSQGLRLYIKNDNRWHDVNNLNISTGSSIMTVQSTSATPVNNINVADISMIFADTTNYDYTIGGFVGGVRGQKLYITKVNPSNILTLEVNESGNSQLIWTPDVGDLAFPNATLGGATLICDGSAWWCVGVAHANSNDT